MKQKFRVEYDSAKCIGAGECARRDPAHFALRNGKAQLRGATQGAQHAEFECNSVEADRLQQAAAHCPSNALRVIGTQCEEVVSTTISYEPNFREVRAAFDDRAEFVLDPKGYFLIRINPAHEIEVAFCTERNAIAWKITGKKPQEIYMTVLKLNIVDRPDHAAYLGRELQKAYDALQAGIPYVQDDDLNFQ